VVNKTQSKHREIPTQIHERQATNDDDDELLLVIYIVRWK
jgi:hypothetical protein